MIPLNKIKNILMVYRKRKINYKRFKKKKQYNRKKKKTQKRKTVMSVETCKKIIRAEREKTRELNIYRMMENDNYTLIGNPILYPHNADDTVIEENIAVGKVQPRAYLITDYYVTHELNSGRNVLSATETNGNIIYAETQKMFLKDILVTLEIQTPFGKIDTRPCVDWCNVYAHIIRTNSRIRCEDGIPIHKLFKDNYWDSTKIFNKDQKIKNGYEFIKSIKINCSPNKRLITKLNTGDDEQPIYAGRKIRKKFKCRINKWLKLKRSMSSNDTHTDARPEGNLNNFNYWFVVSCHQEKQSIASGGSQLYNNQGITGISNLTGAAHCGPQMKFSIEITGYGADGNFDQLPEP